MAHERNTMPRAREIADPEKVAVARKRGESHGFTKEFLDHFIELELEMMQRWENLGMKTVYTEGKF
jgi:hypothetical protein